VTVTVTVTARGGVGISPTREEQVEFGTTLISESVVGKGASVLGGAGPEFLDTVNVGPLSHDKMACSKVQREL